MISKFRGIEIFILWNMSHLVFCRNIFIDRYEILRPHPGLIECAVGYSGKSDIFALTVSQTTDKCEGWTQRFPENQFQDDGYAVKIQSAQVFQPAHVLNDTYVKWMIPSVHDTRDEFHIYFSVSGTNTNNFEMYLSEDIRNAFDDFLYGYSQNETFDFFVRFFSAQGVCLFQGKPVKEDWSAGTISFQENQIHKISIILYEFHVKVLVNNEELCVQSLRSLGDHFDTFKYIYVYAKFWPVKYHKIEFDADAREGIQ